MLCNSNRFHKVLCEVLYFVSTGTLQVSDNRRWESSVFSKRMSPAHSLPHKLTRWMQHGSMVLDYPRMSLFHTFHSIHFVPSYGHIMAIGSGYGLLCPCPFILGQSSSYTQLCSTLLPIVLRAVWFSVAHRWCHFLALQDAAHISDYSWGIGKQMVLSCSEPHLPHYFNVLTQI